MKTRTKPRSKEICADLADKGAGADKIAETDEGAEADITAINLCIKDARKPVANSEFQRTFLE